MYRTLLAVSIMEMTHNNSYPMRTNPVLTPCKQGAVHFSPRPYAQYRWATRCKQRAIHCVFNENEHLTHTLRSKVRYFYVTPSTLETPRSDCEAFLRWCHQESNWGHKASTNKNAPQRLQGVSKVVPPGIEPGTQGFSVLCSTNWAMAPFFFCECKGRAYIWYGQIFRW